MSIAQELILAKVNDTKPPAHTLDKPLSEADTDLEILKSFAYKNGGTLERVLKRYLEIDPDILADLDDSLVLQREQAKIGLDVMKAVTPKDVDHNVQVKVTAIERRIIRA